MSLDIRGIRESQLRVMLLKVECNFKESVRQKFQFPDVYSKNATIKREAGEMDSSPDYCNGFGSPSSTVCASTSDTLDMPSSLTIQLGRNEFERKAALKRYRDFQKWIWKECCNSFSLCAKKIGKQRSEPLLDICDDCLTTYRCKNAHCCPCHGTFNTDVNLSNHLTECEEKRKLDSKKLHTVDPSLPLAVRLIKLLLATVEVGISASVLKSSRTSLGEEKKQNKLAIR